MILRLNQNFLTNVMTSVAFGVKIYKLHGNELNFRLINNIASDAAKRFKISFHDVNISIFYLIIFQSEIANNKIKRKLKILEFFYRIQIYHNKVIYLKQGGPTSSLLRATFQICSNLRASGG